MLRRTRLRYFLVLFLTSFLYLFLGGYIFFFLFVFTIAMPITSYLALCVNRKYLKLQLVRREDTLYIRIQKKNMFPFGHLVGICHIHNVFYEYDEQQNLFVFLDRDREMIELSFDLSKSGVIKVHISDLYIMDLLGLFRYPILIHTDIETIQLPASIHEEHSIAWIKQMISEDLAIGSGQGQELSDDSYEIREYEPGDSLHRVHYKLSFKLSKYMIRHYDHTDAGNSSLFIDLSNLDTVEYTLSLSILAMKQLLEKGFRIDVKWLSGIQHCSYEINQNEDISACIYEILSQPRATSKPYTFDTTNSKGTYIVNEYGVKARSGLMEAGECNDE